jgi:phosphoglycolate phosphatase
LNYRAAIFDLDGTLADTLQTIAAALNHGLTAIDRPTLSLPAVARIVGEGVTMLCRKALDGDADADEALLAALERATRAFYAEHPMLECRLYPGIADMLDGLRDAEVRLAVLSNKPHDLTVATLSGLGIESRFVEILGARDDFPRKPDPTSARYLAGRLGVGSERILYVGDTPIDMATAKAARLPVAAVTWGFRSEAELRPHCPDHLISSPEEIVRLCRST